MRMQMVALHDALDAGLITLAEFEKRRAQLAAQMQAHLILWQRNKNR